MMIADHHDRVAGPDHELGAVRGVQPAALALARERGHWCRCRRRSSRSSCSATRRSTSCRSSRRCGSCAACRRGDRSTSFVWRHPLDQPGGADLRDRLRVSTRCSRSSVSHAAVHLLAGHPVRVGVRGQVVPVPAAVGVVARDAGDDPGGRARVPRRHRHAPSPRSWRSGSRSSAPARRSARSS